MVFPPRNELMDGELRQRIRESALDPVLLVRLYKQLKKDKVTPKK
jgi:hypothetical protein